MKTQYDKFEEIKKQVGTPPKFTKEFLEKGIDKCNSHKEALEFFKTKNLRYINFLIKQYGLSGKLPTKFDDRPLHDRIVIKNKNIQAKIKLMESTSFLDNEYKIVPYQQRTWHIKNDKLEVQKCVCGNLMIFTEKRYKYCSQKCTNLISTNKTKETCLKRYGVINGGLLPKFKYKDYVLPSGRIIKIQGFENKALDILLKTYNEYDILCSHVEIKNYLGGHINYEFKGTQRKYYPDFYIKSINTIIEVKSLWTYNLQKEKNELKRLACLNIGLKFEFMFP